MHCCESAFRMSHGNLAQVMDISAVTVEIQPLGVDACMQLDCHVILGSLLYNTIEQQIDKRAYIFIRLRRLPVLLIHAFSSAKIGSLAESQVAIVRQRDFD